MTKVLCKSCKKLLPPSQFVHFIYGPVGMCHPCRYRSNVKGQNSRAFCKGIPGVILEQEWIDIRANHRNRCAYCKTKKADLVIDHIVPLSKGGENTAANIQPLCVSCNCRKHANDHKRYAMLTTKEAAEKLGVGVSTVRLWCKIGRFPNAKIYGRDWLIPLADVEGMEKPKRGRPWPKKEE